MDRGAELPDARTKFEGPPALILAGLSEDLAHAYVYDHTSGLTGGPFRVLVRSTVASAGECLIADQT